MCAGLIFCTQHLYVDAYVRVCVHTQSVNKVDDRFSSTVRWFLRRSEIATGLWEESGDQVWHDGASMVTALWVCFLAGSRQLTDDIAFPHPGTSPPSKCPPTFQQPCLCWILAGSELNRRGLSNQTTHAKGNGEEKDGVMGVCCLTVNALLGGGRRVVCGLGMRGFFVQYVLCENLWDPEKSVLEEEITLISGDVTHSGHTPKWV